MRLRSAARVHLGWWALAALPLGYLALLFGWPFLAVVWRGFSDAADGFGPLDALGTTRAARVVVTTLALAAAGSLGSVVCGVPAAWALYRLRWRGVGWARAAASVPFALPTVVVAASFSALVRRGGPLGEWGLDQTPLVIVAALVFYNVSVVMRVVGSAWASLDPRLTAAARTLGASRAQAWLRVTLPALTPAIASAAALTFLFCASSFGIVLVLGGSRVSTIETEIYVSVTSYLDLGTAAALSLVQVIVVAAALLVSERARARSERALALLDVDGTRHATRSDAPAVVAVLIGLLLLYGAPLGALVERSLRAAGGGYTIAHYAALAHTPARGVLPEPVLSAALRSLAMAGVATALAVILGLTIAALARVRSRRASLVEAAMMLPLGVSSVMVGLGLLLTFHGSILGVELRSSWWLVPLGQSVVALPFVVRLLVPAARTIPPRMRSAAATLGASPWAVWWRVDFPLLRRPLGSAIGLAGAISIGEFGATAFLARPDAPTLTTAIVKLLGRPGADNVGQGFAAAVLLGVMVAVVMALAEGTRQGRRHA